MQFLTKQSILLWKQLFTIHDYLGFFNNTATSLIVLVFDGPVLINRDTGSYDCRSGVSPSVSGSLPCLWNQSRHFLRISIGRTYEYLLLWCRQFLLCIPWDVWIRYEVGFTGRMASASISVGFFTQFFSPGISVVNGLPLWLLSNVFSV